MSKGHAIKSILWSKSPGSRSLPQMRGKIFHKIVNYSHIGNCYSHIGKRTKHLGQTTLLVLPIFEFIFWFIVDENNSPVLKKGTKGATLTFLISTPTWWLSWERSIYHKNCDRYEIFLRHPLPKWGPVIVDHLSKFDRQTFQKGWVIGIHTCKLHRCLSFALLF